MDDLKTCIRTKQCEFEIQLEATTRLALELQDLNAQEYEGERPGRCVLPCRKSAPGYLISKTETQALVRLTGHLLPASRAGARVMSLE
ncbi:MAG: hypothetical protein ABI905_17525 [Betaproteobacteria bacterium]